MSSSWFELNTYSYLGVQPNLELGHYAKLQEFLYQLCYSSLSTRGTCWKKECKSILYACYAIMIWGCKGFVLPLSYFPTSLEASKSPWLDLYCDILNLHNSLPSWLITIKSSNPSPQMNRLVVLLYNTWKIRNNTIFLYGFCWLRENI